MEHTGRVEQFWRRSTISDRFRDEEKTERASQYTEDDGKDVERTNLHATSENGNDSMSPNRHVLDQNEQGHKHEASTEEDGESANFAEADTLTRKRVKPSDNLSMILGPPVILILDLVVPCSIYYGWLNRERNKWRQSCNPYQTGNSPCPFPKPVYDERILGISIVSFGLGELYILIARVIRLISNRKECAPLLSKHWWELDATSWVYGTALLVALIPFTVSTSVHHGIPWLYLYPPGFIMAFLVLISLITLLPIRLPLQVNSEPRGSPMKPLVYFAAEDFIAVDGFQGREFRNLYRARYETSPDFRRFLLRLTLFWIFGACMYIGLLSAIIWNLEFEYAFGTSLGLLFGWIISWASITLLWVKLESGRQRKNRKGKSNGDGGTGS